MNNPFLCRCNTSLIGRRNLSYSVGRIRLVQQRLGAGGLFCLNYTLSLGQLPTLQTYKIDFSVFFVIQQVWQTTQQTTPTILFFLEKFRRETDLLSFLLLERRPQRFRKPAFHCRLRPMDFLSIIGSLTQWSSRME